MLSSDAATASAVRSTDNRSWFTFGETFTLRVDLSARLSVQFLRGGTPIPKEVV